MAASQNLNPIDALKQMTHSAYIAVTTQDVIGAEVQAQLGHASGLSFVPAYTVGCVYERLAPLQVGCKGSSKVTFFYYDGTRVRKVIVDLANVKIIEGYMGDKPKATEKQS